uniref:Uncharacterized protein n=1 Tax=Plectus sambesii TaxID=2011161 RepID=A0A914UX90_9BILA
MLSCYALIVCALAAFACAESGVFPPAAENYKVMTPYPTAAPLPPSAKAYHLLDVLRGHSGNEELTAEDIQDGLDRPTGVHRVAMSSAFHPDTLAAARQPAFEPAAPAPPPSDAFVVNEEREQRQGAIVAAAGPVEDQGGPISNPAKFFLAGANFENIATPKCRLMGCDGPFPNDGNVNFGEPEAKKGETCHQTFVPLNSCINDRGYPVGMSCTICCECADDFVKEMKKSHGYPIDDLREQNSQ